MQLTKADIFFLPSPIFTQNLGAVLLSTFEQHIGDKFTPKAKDAWLAAYTFIVDTIFQENQELSDGSGGSSPEK